MRKTLFLALAGALASQGIAPAQSAKQTVQVSRVTLIEQTTTTGGWTTILGNADPTAANAVRIHTSQQKDLILVSSIECGLLTKTRTKSSGGNADTETATATVKLRILVDPGPGGAFVAATRIAEPGSDPTPDASDDTGINYCHRKQQLTAKLQGIITGACFPGGVFDPTVPGCLLDEEIELLLETLEASSFSFVLDDLGAGVHNIIVQAKIDTSASSADSEAKGLVGRGALTVEEVRLVKNQGILVP